MSKDVIHSCDFCGDEAVHQLAMTIETPPHWTSVRRGFEVWDFCSPSCLRKWGDDARLEEISTAERKAARG